MKRSSFMLPIDPKIIEEVLPSQYQERDICESCGQEVGAATGFTPQTYAHFVNFFAAWVRLPEQSRDLIAAMVVNPGQDARYYYPNVSRKSANAAIKRAIIRFNKIMRQGNANHSNSLVKKLFHRN